MISIKELRQKIKDNDYDLTGFSDEENELFCRAENVRRYEGKLVRHFKGELYLILYTVEHAETGEELVIYKAMYGDKKYASEMDMFISKVDKDKHPDVEQKYIFELLELILK